MPKYHLPGILDIQPVHGLFNLRQRYSILARGQYTTIWHINNWGEWKFLIDLGVDNTPASLTNTVKEITAPKQRSKPTKTPSLVKAENAFIELFKENSAKAYKKYLSKESILNRNGYAPATSVADQKIIIDSTTSDIQFTMDGWNTSPGMDMGYTYGTTVLKDKTENYQRIWRYEPDGWKIALEVLRY